MKKFLVIPLIIALIVGGSACTGKTQATTGITTVADVQAMVEALEAKVITLENRQNTAVNPADVAAAKADIATVKNELAALRQQVSNIPNNGITQSQLDSATASLKAQISTLTAQVNTLTTEIAALKAPPTSTTQPAQAVEVSIKYLFPTLAYAATFPGAQTGQFRIDVKNNATVAIKDIQFAVYFVQSAAVTYSTSPALTSQVAMGGTPVMWQYGGLQSNALLFANGLGFNLNAGETKSITVTLALNSADVVSVQYQPYIFAG